MPTALFFASETHTVLYGAEAMQAYLNGTEGRLLRSLKSLMGSRADGRVHRRGRQEHPLL